MIGSELVNMMKFRLSRATSGSTELDTWMYQELNAAQTRLEASATLPWFLITERAYQIVQQYEERVALPQDFLREVDSDNLQIEDMESGEFTELTKRQYDVARARYDESELGLPKLYTLSGGYYRLRPIPDKTTYRLWMTYYAKAAVITSTLENGWTKYMPDLLMGEAGVIIATALRNEQAMALFSGLIKVERDRMLRENIAREMENFEPNPED